MINTALQPKELMVVKLLSEAWNIFIELPEAEYMHADFENAINQAHRIMAMRVARRVNPEVWR